MTTVVLGNNALDMTNLETLGLGTDALFSTEAPELVAFTETSIVLRDPVTQATISVFGNFGVEDLAEILIDRIAVGSPTLGTLFEAGGLGLTFDRAQTLLAAGGGITSAIDLFLTCDDFFTGSPGNDFLNALAGNDILNGGSGNDTLIGGLGDDSALFAAARAAYSVAKVGADWRVTANTGTEGTDVLQGIETIRFADVILPLVKPAAAPGAPVPAYGANSGFLFDPVYYLLDNTDLLPTVDVSNALQHYLGTGAAQERNPNSWFDPAYYSNRWNDLKALNLDDATLFMHYNLYGVWEGRSAGPKFDQFDGTRYLRDNPGVAAYVDPFIGDFLGSRTNGAIAHYVIYGANEQRAAYDTAGTQIDLGFST